MYHCMSFSTRVVRVALRAFNCLTAGVDIAHRFGTFTQPGMRALFSEVNQKIQRNSFYLQVENVNITNKITPIFMYNI